MIPKKKKPEAREVEREKVFVVTPLENAGDHVGRSIRVKLLSGKTVKGILTGIKPKSKSIEITKHLEGGTFAYPIQNSMIQELRVEN